MNGLKDVGMHDRKTHCRKRTLPISWMASNTLHAAECLLLARVHSSRQIVRAHACSIAMASDRQIVIARACSIAHPWTPYTILYMQSTVYSTLLALHAHRQNEA